MEASELRFLNGLRRCAHDVRSAGVETLNVAKHAIQLARGPSLTASRRTAQFIAADKPAEAFQRASQRTFQKSPFDQPRRLIIFQVSA